MRYCLIPTRMSTIKKMEGRKERRKEGQKEGKKGNVSVV